MSHTIRISARIFASFVILTVFASSVRCLNDLNLKKCFTCEEDRSPPIKKPTCNKTKTCGEFSPYCFAQVVRKSNGNIKFSKGCTSAGNSGKCGSEYRCEDQGYEACKVTCCDTSECNVSFPELSGGSTLVLGVIPMITSIIFSLAFL